MAKKSILIEESIPAGAVNQNIVANKRFENVNRNSLMTVAMTGSAAGLSTEIWVSDRNAVESSPIGAANRRPLVPDDVIVNDVDAVAGEKIAAYVSNGAGVAVTVFALFILDDNVQFV